jgi:hypothetical protein
VCLALLASYARSYYKIILPFVALTAPPTNDNLNCNCLPSKPFIFATYISRGPDSVALAPLSAYQVAEKSSGLTKDITRVETMLAFVSSCPPLKICLLVGRGKGGR